MKDVFISDSIVYVGVDDKNIDLFESQYVVPNGVSYNSYVILDDKITIMDTVDRRGTEGWLANLKKTLGDKKPYYVVVSVPWMQTSHGKTKQDAILSTSLANTAYRFRIF